MPFIVLLLPTLTFFSTDLTHKLLAAALPLVALVAFVPGYRRHRQKVVLWLGLSGLVLIVFAAVAAFRLLTPIQEIAITVSGSAFLIAAHWYNRHCCEVEEAAESNYEQAGQIPENSSL